MKPLACLLLLGLGLGSCSQQSASPLADAPMADAAKSTSVVGTWQLTRLETGRAGNSLPNQRLTLTSNQQLQFYDNDKLAAEGTYTLGTGSACSAAASPDPLLRVALSTPAAYAPHGNYTLRGDTLVIDQCLAADGPRYTFQRQR